MSIEKGTRTRLTTVLILFLVLLTGAVLGIAADRRLEGTVASSESRDGETERGRGSEGDTQGEEGGGDAARQRHLIVEQVGLSTEQKVQVDSIVNEYRQRVRELQDQLQDELREAYTPRYRELLEQTRTEIKGVLSADQAVAYDSLLAERDRRREQRRDSVPGSRPAGRP
jgi:hypothetical protein